MEAKGGGLLEFEDSLIYIYSDFGANQALIVRPYLKKKKKVITFAFTFRVSVPRLSFKPNRKFFF